MNASVVLLVALISFGVTAVSGIWLIPWLHRLKFGQSIRDDGPTWHQNKQGTPTIGGLMFIPGILIAAAIGWSVMANVDATFAAPEQRINIARFWAGLMLAGVCGFIGFLDDYIKVVKKRNLGLRAREKFFLQMLAAVTFLLTLYLSGDTGTFVVIPFVGTINFGWLYYPFMVFLIVGFINAVNITDGIDGLAASVTFVAALCYMLMAGLMSYTAMSLLSTALAGGCIGFLLWNFHPAKVFMGDTGSLFLGGMVIAIAFGLGLPVFLLLVGVVYLLETFSVMLQIAYFKLTKGKRIFKMSPVHHHFEMEGWSENRIVTVFSAVGFLGGAVAVLAVVL